MLAVPAWVWRFPPFVRALIVGIAFGVVLGILAGIGSNSVLAAVVAFIVIVPLHGTIMARRMSKAWPGAKNLSGGDRVAVARAARAGADIGDPRLAGNVIEFSRGMHDAIGRYRLFRWLFALIGVVALGVAILDTIFSSAGEAVVSWLYFAFFPVEVIWWPRREAQLVANAERAEESARELLAQQPPVRPD